MRISERDYRRALALTHGVAEAADAEAFARASLEGIAGLVSSDIVSLNEVEPERERFAYWSWPAAVVVPPGADALFARHADAHPLIADFVRTGDGSAKRISDVATEEEWHANPLHAGYYVPLGVEFQVSIALAAPRPTTVAFALNRGERDFDGRDVAVLDLVRPHLAQAWRNARERERLSALAAAGSAALTHDGSSVIVLDDPIEELTPGALVELYRFFGRPSAHGPLPHSVERWVEAQRRRDVESELLRPHSASLEGRRLVLRFLPGAAGRPDALLAQRADPDLPAPRLAAVGLSAREAEVLALVGTGATNAEVGDRLHIAPSTVKKHLDAIYRKLGVSGRGRAVAAAAEILAHHH